MPQKQDMGRDLPMGEIACLFPGKSLEDDAQLQRLARRRCPLPLAVVYRVEDGQLIARIPGELQGEADEGLRHWQEVENGGGSKEKQTNLMPLFQRILEINPWHARSRVGLTYELIDRHEIDGALEVLVDWILCDPGSAEGYALIPMLLPEKHRGLETTKLYVEKGLEIDGDHPGFLYMKGWLELNSGKPEAAYPLFQRSLEGNSEFVHAHYLKACSCVQMDRLEEAAESMESMFRIVHGRSTLAAENLETSVEEYQSLCLALSARHEESYLELAWREQHRLEREFGWEIRWCGKPEDDEVASRRNSIHRVGGHDGLCVEIHGTADELESGFYRMLQLVTLRWLVRPGGDMGADFNRHASQWVKRCGRLIVEPREDEDADGVSESVASQLEILLRDLLVSPVEWMLVRDILAENSSFRWKAFTWWEVQARSWQSMLENEESMEHLQSITRNVIMVAMGARTLFLDEITHGAFDFTAFYRGHATWKDSVRLFRLWQQRIHSECSPVDPYGLIDDAARIAGIQWSVPIPPRPSK